ncbi:MAG: divergent polysaccharide deacetylase family protein [Mariprofundaceae bacterium]|nr:divergent polysaccharide deacetylase family protein [Mariprofundaceae bacterium]
MSRRVRPIWVYALLSGLLAVLLLGLWLAADPPLGNDGSKALKPPVISKQVVKDTMALTPSPANATHPSPEVVFEENHGRDAGESSVPDDEPAQIESPKSHHGIALILDDVGYDLPALRRAIALKLPMAIAILPNAPHASAAAELAHQAGYPVMLHMPMEPANPHYSKLMDKSFIRAGMQRDVVRRMLHEALIRVPHVEGVNNHMGSRLTTLEQPMRWVMEVCKEQKLFFVDSRTNKDSIAAKVANETGLRWGQRRVFLDDSVKSELLMKSWQAARKRLISKGSVIVIAHPHRETLDFLEMHVTASDRAVMVPIGSLLSPASSPPHRIGGG